MSNRSKRWLFDHLVGGHDKLIRHLEAKCLRGSEINSQLDFDRELDGKLARFRALQDAISKIAARR